MGQSPLEKALRLIEELEPEELLQIDQALRERLRRDHEASAEEAFEQALVASGLVKEIKRPSTRPAWDRPLVKIQGEPLSETIIRERR